MHKADDDIAVPTDNTADNAPIANLDASGPNPGHPISSLGVDDSPLLSEANLVSD